MTTRPFTVSSAKARQLLDGATQLRVPLDPQPLNGELWPFPATALRGKHVRFRNAQTGQLQDVALPVAPGDVIWIKEAWRAMLIFDDSTPKQMWDGAHEAGYKDPIAALQGSIGYEADGTGFSGRLRPAITMPQWASRLTYRVKDVRVEQVRDISEEDAVAEGMFVRLQVEDHPKHPVDDGAGKQQKSLPYDTPIEAFQPYSNVWVAVLKLEKEE